MRPMASLDCLEDVLMSHMYTYPICENIIRMNDSLTFEHETLLPSGNWVLVIYQYDSKNGLTTAKIFDRDELNDVTEQYKNEPNVQSVIQLISQEIYECERQKKIDVVAVSLRKNQEKRKQLP
jgi:hypothetical protein